MKKRMLALALALLLTGCQAAQSGSEPPTLSVKEPSASSQLPQEEVQAWVAELGFSRQHTTTEREESSMTQIAVSWDGGQAVYELNHSPAAQSLLAQLPLTIQVEDYSTNEKIFYPEEGLDTSDTPLAQAGAGTLAYYEPWGDVVFFYGDYSENPGLFELGQVVSGGDLISQMSGTITIEATESQKGGNHDA